MQAKTLIELVREYGNARHMAACSTRASASNYRAKADQLFAEIAKRIECNDHNS